jgi:FixJ family two-component response regulator
MCFPECYLISIIDDDESIRASTKALLRSVGYRARSFASADDFLNSGILGETECLILDVRMPGIDGLQLQRRLRNEGFRIPTIMVTGYDDRFLRQRALQWGAVNVLHKPFNAAFFLTVVQIALRGEPAHIPYRALVRLAQSYLTESAKVTFALSPEESDHFHKCPECIKAVANIIREIVCGRHQEKRSAEMGIKE